MYKYVVNKLRKSVLTFVVMFSFTVSFAQNLVPNPSFETVNCQNSFFLPWGCTIENNLPWTATTLGSPDSYNSCHSGSNYMYGTPENYTGSQHAKSGNGYAGIFTYSTEQGQDEYREYISVAMSSDLQAGSSYKISYYVSLADHSQYSTYAPSAYISDNSIGDNTHGNALNQYSPQISTSTFVNDTTNWVLITANYTAIGGERYITIGNFNTDANTSNQNVNPNGQLARAYYYIDDISVQEQNPTPIASFNLSSSSVCQGNCTSIAENSINATDQPINSWTWTVNPTNGAPIIDNVQNPATVCWNTPGTYDITLTVSDGINTDDTTVQIIVLEEIQLDLGADTVICSGDYILDAGNDGSTFLWHDGSTSQLFNATETGVHYVTVSNGTCVETREIFLVFPGLDLDLGQQMILCESNVAQGVELDALNAGSSYLWSTGSTNQQITIDSAGIYFVTVTDSYGYCSITDTTEVVEQEFNLSFNTLDTAGCIDLTASFENSSSVNNGTVSNWLWDFGDGANSTDEHPTHTYTTVGDYDVTLSVISANGCQKDTTFISYIHTFPWAVADFSSTSGDIIADSEVNFYNQSSNSDSWNWDFNGESQSNEENPTNTFSEAGVFDVTLIAENVHGCNDTIRKVVRINDDITIYVPNAFTPDGNSKNDEWNFSVLGVDESDFLVMIFDRWGELIWDSYDTHASWDGTYKGNLVQDGTFTWVIKCKSRLSAEKRMFTGSIHLIN